MASRGGGGWLNVILAFLVVLAVLWFAAPDSMPTPLRDQVCVAP